MTFVAGKTCKEKWKREFLQAGSLSIFLFVSLVNTPVAVTVGFKQEQESLNKLTLLYF